VPPEFALEIWIKVVYVDVAVKSEPGTCHTQIQLIWAEVDLQRTIKESGFKLERLFIEETINTMHYLLN
jgi:hypothetical protein